MRERGRQRDFVTDHLQIMTGTARLEMFCHHLLKISTRRHVLIFSYFSSSGQTLITSPQQLSDYALIFNGRLVYWTLPLYIGFVFSKAVVCLLLHLFVCLLK